MAGHKGWEKNEIKIRTRGRKERDNQIQSTIVLTVSKVTQSNQTRM